MYVDCSQIKSAGYEKGLYPIQWPTGYSDMVNQLKKVFKVRSCTFLVFDSSDFGIFVHSESAFQCIVPKRLEQSCDLPYVVNYVTILLRPKDIVKA